MKKKNRFILLCSLAVSLLAVSFVLVTTSFAATPHAHEHSTTSADQCVPSGGNYVYPLDIDLDMSDTFGSRILHSNGGAYSRYDFHRGLDWKADQGTPVYAVTDGTIVDIEKNWTSGTGGGNHILIYHEAIDCETRYAHLDAVSTTLDIGSVVTTGQQIGTVGSTGATYDHLHFEVRQGEDGTQRAAIHPLESPFIPYTNEGTPNTNIIGAFPDAVGLTALVEVTSTVTQPDVDSVAVTVSSGGGEDSLDFDSLNANTAAMASLDDPLVDNICIIPYDLEDDIGYRTLLAFRHLDYNTSSDVSVTTEDVHGYTDTDTRDLDSSVAISPVEQEATVVPGSSITLTFTLTNSATTTQTFDLELLSGQGWSYSLPADEVELGAGASSTFDASINIDTDSFGTADCGFLVAASQDQTTPSTVAGYYRIYRDAHVDATNGDDTTGTGSQTAPFATINHAIGETDSGGAVRVAEGSYTEVIELDSTISLLGGYDSTNWQDRTFASGNTVIDAAGLNSFVLEVSGDHGPLIEGFTLQNGNRSSGSGGGLRLVGGAAPTVQNNWIINNTAKSGGGIYIAANGTMPPTIQNNTIANNSSTSNGGGIYIDSRDATIEDNDISENHADGHGGGLYFKNNTPATINNNSIENNTTEKDGGGMYLNDHSAPTISNNTIANNAADDDGGGLYLDDDTAPIITNNIFWENDAYDDGQAIVVDPDSTASIFHNTLAGNSGDSGDGIYTKNSADPRVTNNIIIGYNRAIACSTSIDASYTLVVASSDIDSDCSASDTVTGNPLLDATYRLSATSPAIDAGTDVSVLVDIDGDERGSAPDIGADEYVP